MNRNFKKSFFSSLLVVLFIISNLIGLKYTNFLDMVVSVNFLTYPFITLMVMLLMDTFGKKETYYSITSAVFIQIILLIVYSLTVNLSGQLVIPDMGQSVNKVFMLEEVPVLASLIGFMVSNYILIYLFDYFKAIGKRVLGVMLGTILSLIVYGLIYISISYYSYGVDILLNLLLGHIVMSSVMAFVVTIIFYILKEKENIYEQKNIFINDVNIKEEHVHKNIDKSVLEVINLKETKAKKKNNSSKQKVKNSEKKVIKSKTKKDSKTDKNSKKDSKK